MRKGSVLVAFLRIHSQKKGQAISDGLAVVGCAFDPSATMSPLLRLEYQP